MTEFVPERPLLIAVITGIGGLIGYWVVKGLLDFWRYEALWQSNCPLYRENIVATLGGWNMPWPDGDFERLMFSKLLIWTFEEAEPWVEVFRSGAALQVFQRIT